ncbi:hypothetical protein [uncultured Mobiluncus sp.]|uniref:hypothetical protein n=1 Tax=uncultured Mobiluncus sp. TaxID=293425 RepID=UPI0027D9BB76|nr:hypothetical protein [uncultured Mobiluncus sp.]
MAEKSLVTKTTKTATKLMTGVAALALAGGLLSGCEAKPGVAAYGDGWVVTEAQIGTVTKELAEAGINLNDTPDMQTARIYALRYLRTLNEGGKDLLSQCPQLDEIKTDLFKVDPAQMSPETRDVMQLLLCATATDQGVAHELGVSPVNSQVAAQIEQAYQAGFGLDDAKLSNRMNQTIQLIQQRAAQMQMMGQAQQ